MNHIRLTCDKCGGQKFAGAEYYSLGEYYVDITCVVCSDTKDVKVKDFKRFIAKLSKKRGYRD